MVGIPDHIFLMQVPSSLLGLSHSECTPRPSAALLNHSIAESEDFCSPVLGQSLWCYPRSAEQSVPVHARGSWFVLE